jgi:hypothetical protein
MRGQFIGSFERLVRRLAEIRRAEYILNWQHLFIPLRNIRLGLTSARAGVYLCCYIYIYQGGFVKESMINKL